jgi:hypothetical protein
MLFYLIVYSCLSNFFSQSGGTYRNELGHKFVFLYLERLFFHRQTLKDTTEVFLVSLNNQSKFQIIYFVRLIVYIRTSNFFSYLTSVTIYIYRYA